MYTFICIIAFLVVFVPYFVWQWRRARRRQERFREEYERFKDWYDDQIGSKK